METVFHCFYDCQRLCDLFNALHFVFRRCGETGLRPPRRLLQEGQRLQVAAPQPGGERGPAGYLEQQEEQSGRQDRTGQEALPIFKSSVKARVWID